MDKIRLIRCRPQERKWKGTCEIPVFLAVAKVLKHIASSSSEMPRRDMFRYGKPTLVADTIQCEYANLRLSPVVCHSFCMLPSQFNPKTVKSRTGKTDQEEDQNAG